jgi:hypothetical protein
MALRDERSARRGRARLGRAGFVALAAALYLAAAAAATWPALREADDRFLARSAPGYGEAAAGDHLQTAYNLWLVGHQLGRGGAPWLDPYSFQPEAEPVANLQGWLFGLPFWPLVAAVGPVVAWNLFTLLSFVLAGGFACAWVRELNVPRAAALAGGLAFALAPYRVGQSTGHLLGPISALVPLALLAFERSLSSLSAGRSRAWQVLAGAALAAIPLSGQLHLALGAIPLFLGYTFVRTRKRRARVAAGLGALAAAVAGLLVHGLVIADSIASGGRSLASVERYSADWQDFVTRDVRSGIEQFVFLGWLTPLLGVAGFVLLVQARRIGLAVVLGVAVLAPALLALGTNLPTYEPLWNAVPPFRFPRVPERLMPIACLALAALVAFALARIRAPVAAGIVVLVLVFDLRVPVYSAVRADEGSRVYAALQSAPPGRLLELPVFRPDLHFGSAYLYYSMQAPRERPQGYSTLAPKHADGVIRRLVPLSCGGRRLDRLRAFGVRYVAVHRGLYEQSRFFAANCANRVERALARRGFQLLARDGPVAIFFARSNR